MFKNREYKSGTRWCLWRWSFVDNKFITRLHIVKTPWFAVALHFIHKPDPEPWLHDHPVSFLSIILRGSYTEERLKQADYGISWPVKRKWFNYIKASPRDRHTITKCDPRTVTLCFMGPKTREWGYHIDKGWIHWKEYTHGKYRQSQTQ